jgi:hypothetical protein
MSVSLCSPWLSRLALPGPAAEPVLLYSCTTQIRSHQPCHQHTLVLPKRPLFIPHVSHVASRRHHRHRKFGSEWTCISLIQVHHRYITRLLHACTHLSGHTGPSPKKHKEQTSSTFPHRPVLFRRCTAEWTSRGTHACRTKHAQLRVQQAGVSKGPAHRRHAE